MKKTQAPVKKKKADVAVVPMHPHTLKYLHKGHPWVTKDTYTASFPDWAQLLRPKMTTNDGHFVLLHDPKHQQIKARLWKYVPGQWMGFTKGNFKHELKERLTQALVKRIESGIPVQRENWYWCFGEADQLPGLHILYLKDVLWIQFYAYFWSRLQRELVQMLEEILSGPQVAGAVTRPSILALQMRAEGNQKEQAPLILQHWGDWKVIDGVHEWQLHEGGIQYKLTLGGRYDGGIYTDMAHVRAQLLPVEIFQQKAVLNLFSYTGAFSLWALKHGARDVVSVDISPWALERLEDNLALNPGLSTRHKSWRISVSQALQSAEQQGLKFDTIICDPPPFSSDGKKQQTAQDMYKQNLSSMRKLLSKDGNLIVMSNLHQQTRQQWEKTMAPLFTAAELSIHKKFGLGGDCPVISAFPEGDYLKVYWLKPKA